MPIESEARFLRVDHDDMRRRLKACGFELKTTERLMRRKIFTLPGIPPLRKWGRVRDEGYRVTMTIKTAEALTVEGTREDEVAIVQDFDTGCAFMTACGLVEASYQETLREDWQRGHGPDADKIM